MLYESTFIIDGYLQDDKQASTVARIEKIVNDNGGKVLKLERLGKRRLAYEINRKQHGYYLFMLFETQNPKLPGELDREFRLNENVIRYLTTKFERRAPLPEILSAPAPAIPVEAAAMQPLVTADAPAVSVETAQIESPSPDVKHSGE